MNRWTQVAVVLMAALCAVTARAEVVRLHDGRLLQGKVIGHNGIEVVLERWDTGGQVTIPFKDMLAGDRKRIEQRLGYRSLEDFIERVEASRLTLKQSSDRPIGVIDQARSTPTKLMLMRRGNSFAYERAQIERIDSVAVAETDVYTPEAIYERRRVEIELKTPQDARDHYELARYIETLGLFEEAKLHFERAIELDATHYEIKVRAAVTRLEELIQNRDALAAYRMVLSAKGNNEYALARTRLDELKAAYATVPFPKSFDVLAAEIDAAEAEWLNAQLMRLLHASARALAWEQAKLPQLTLDEALAYGRGQLQKDLLAKLALKMKVDDKTIVTVFDNRSSKQLHKLAFGNGTFLLIGGGGGGGGGTGGAGGAGGGGRGGEGAGGGKVNIGGREINIGQLLGQGGKNGKNGQPADPRTTWWQRADIDARSTLIYAAWAMKSLTIEKEEDAACGQCGALGVITIYGDSTSTQQTCPRCNGAKIERTIYFK